MSDRREPRAGDRCGVAIISTAHGEGSGAEAVLEHLLHGWRGELPIGVVAPVDSRVGRAAVETQRLLAPLPTGRDALAANVVGALRSVRAYRRSAIVHAWHARGYELAAMTAAICGAAYTLTVHDHPHCAAHGRGRRMIVRTALRSAGRVAFVSGATRDAWLRSHPVAPHEVIRNGLVDRPRRAAGRRRPSIGFLGMNAGIKGFEIVADWIARTANEPFEWRLYGDVAPEYRAPLAAVLSSATNRVVHAGRTPTGEIFDEIDVLVHASTAFDSLPTVLLEAARAGVPVVASSQGGAGEIVVHGGTGLLFDPAAPASGLAGLRTLLSDRALAQRFAAAARERYERHFAVAEMAASYGSFWQQMLERRALGTGGSAC